MTSLFLPEKSAGRATFNLDVWDNMEGGAGSSGGTGPAGVTGSAGSDEVPGAGDEGEAVCGFLDGQGQVAEMKMFSTGSLCL